MNGSLTLKQSGGGGQNSPLPLNVSHGVIAENKFRITSFQDFFLVQLWTKFS